MSKERLDKWKRGFFPGDHTYLGFGECGEVKDPTDVEDLKAAIAAMKEAAKAPELIEELLAIYRKENSGKVYMWHGDYSGETSSAALDKMHAVMAKARNRNPKAEVP